jgi:hypothetical protein
VTRSASPSALRPANNHKLFAVRAMVAVSDAGSGASGPNGFTLVSVTSSQAGAGLRPDDVASDIQGCKLGQSLMALAQSR